MADIDKLVAELTLDEKASLTAGADLWSTVPVDRLGIPKVRVTDGPNGARGPVVPGEGAATSACVPCGSALGATWDPALVEEVGQLLGAEARRKGCRVLLAPTVNIHRSPLAGRNFECYSEDPLLSGRIAAGFVRGVQSQRVATTVKHFVGNDAEFERHTTNSVIDERTLREIYLTPFEIAVREGGALGVMTGYNRVNGPWCAEHEGLVRGILRDEWGFEGFVISDWFAMGSTARSAAAGLDLEMPGPGRFFGPALAAAVRDGAVEERLVDDAVRRQLRVWDRLGVFDDGDADTEETRDLPEDRALARRAPAASMVLLANDGVLPLDRAALRLIAVIGPNADRPQIMGGGSANFRPHYRRSPLEALTEKVGDSVAVRHARGCDTDRAPSPLFASQLGHAGMHVELFDGTEFDGPVVATLTVPDSRLLFFSDPAPGLSADSFSARATARFTPDESGTHTFTLIQGGRARLLLDGEVVLDGVTDPPPRGPHFFGLGSAEIRSTVDIDAGRTYDLVIEYSGTGSFIAHGVSVGCLRPRPPGLIADAAALAADSDVAVVIVGTNADWESEGYDRADMRLPGEQDELIRRVAAANPNTIVIVNTGAPVAMGWAADVRAVLQVWFGGQEMANALADVVVGDDEPGARLPTTMPVRLEHNPSFGNFPGENGEVRYGEGVLVGYRWYEARSLPVRFPFGHGLSYSSFTIGPARPSRHDFQPGRSIRVEVDVTNVGSRPGQEVVQCYVAPPPSHLMRPPKELKAFAKVELDPGATATVVMELDDRAFAYWDPGQAGWLELARRAAETSGRKVQVEERQAKPGWRIDPGVYELHIGRSSAEISHVTPITVDAG